MQTAIVYTYSSSPGVTLTLWCWFNDWGTFDAFQAAPSYNQGYNQGTASVTQVRAYMPVADPSLQTPSLAYIVYVKNEGSAGVSMFDVYNAWQ
jgi:hypothetical protein